MKGQFIMFNFSSREYSIRELYDSYNREETILSPKFQRRAVWEYKAKSYLIDTIIRGLPIPRIFIRERSSLSMSIVREIVDGQQRLNAIFDFIHDGFKISKSHNAEYGNMTFSDLPETLRSDFLKYTISSILLIDLDDTEVFDIFARLNTYSIKLNPQELLNSQYFGLYKQLVYRLASEYRSFWLENHILSERYISRMDDAKLITEILSVIVTGKIESNSFAYNSKLYNKYDDEFESCEVIEKNLKSTIDLLSKVYGDGLRDTAFALLPMFYSTILVLYHMNYGIDGFEFSRLSVSESNISKLRTALDEISLVANSTLDESTEHGEFINTIKKHTTTPNVRIKRCKYIAEKIFSCIS